MKHWYRSLITIVLVLAFICSLSLAWAEESSSNPSESVSSSETESESIPESSESSSSSETDSVSVSSPISSEANSSSSLPDISSSSSEASSVVSNNSVLPSSNMDSENTGTQNFSTSSSSFSWNDNMELALTNACKWLSLNEKNVNYLIAAGIAGSTVDISVSTRVQKEISDKGGIYDSAFELEKDILCLVYSGLNPSDFQGLDLISILKSYSDLEKEGLSTVAYALTVYDSNSYDVSKHAKNNRERLVDLLLDSQLENGSYPTDIHPEGDLNLTAVAVMALSNYNDSTEVQEANRKSLQYFLDQRKSDGRFGTGSAYELSNIIVALSSLGISASDSRFVGEHGNLVDLLLEDQLKDGSFPMLDENSGGAIRSTELAVIALVGARYQINPYIQQNALNYQSNGNSANDHTNFSPWIYVGIGVMLLLIIGGIVIFVVRRKQNQDHSKTPQFLDKSGNLPSNDAGTSPKSETDQLP